MTGLARKRCVVHAAREAACLCAECRYAFCRECVTDHDGRLVCAACITALRAGAAASGVHLDAVRGAASIVAAFLLAWFLFYATGRIFLLTEPARHTFSEPPARVH